MALSYFRWAALVAVALAVGCQDKSEPAADQWREGPKQPPGSSAARDTVGGYLIYLPGMAVPIDFSTAADPELQPTGYLSPAPDGAAKIRTVSILPPAGVKLGTAPEELLAALKAYNRAIDTDYLPPETTPITLGGKPALKVVLTPKPREVPKPPAGSSPEVLKAWEADAARAKTDAGRREAFLVTATATRLVFIEVKSAGGPPEGLLKTLMESFTFL